MCINCKYGVSSFGHLRFYSFISGLYEHSYSENEYIGSAYMLELICIGTYEIISFFNKFMWLDGYNR